MGNFTITEAKVLSNLCTDGEKVMRISATGPASYDTGGSELDTSDYLTTMTCCIGQAQGAVAYGPQYVPAVADAAATGLVFVADADGAQEASTTDLSGVTFDFICTGAQ